MDEDGIIGLDEEEEEATVTIVRQGDKEFACTFRPLGGANNYGTYEIRHGSYMTQTAPAQFASEAERHYLLETITSKVAADLDLAAKVEAKRLAAIEQRLEEKRKREAELFGNA